MQGFTKTSVRQLGEQLTFNNSCPGDLFSEAYTYGFCFTKGFGSKSKFLIYFIYMFFINEVIIHYPDKFYLKKCSYHSEQNKLFLFVVKLFLNRHLLLFLFFCCLTLQLSELSCHTETHNDRMCCSASCPQLDKSLRLLLTRWFQSDKTADAHTVTCFN